MTSFPDTFTCASCHQTFEKAWTDEEAAEELEDTFGNFEPSDCDVVCDDCYREMMDLPSISEVAP